MKTLMPRRAARRVLLPLLLLLLVAPAAPAQTYSRGTYSGANSTRWNNPMSASLNRMLNRNILSRSIARRQASGAARGAGGSKAPRTTTTAAPAPSNGAHRPDHGPLADDGATAFRPVAPSIYPQQLAREAASSEAERKEMEAVFAMCLQNYEANMRRRNQPVKDVARAVSYFLGVNYNVLHGGTTVTPAQGLALRAGIKDALGADESFRRLSDREKQQIYETMAVLAEFVALNMSVADERGNRQLAEATRSMAKDNLEKLLGVSAASIRITDAGLEF